MTAQSELPLWLRVASGTLAALFSGYGLASLAAACAVTLPMARSDAVLTGMVVGLVVQVVWGDVGLNGLFDLVSSNRAPSQIIERIDLLRGPGALINGIAPGGSMAVATASERTTRSSRSPPAPKSEPSVVAECQRR